eukprot:3407459-Alexandrium_andersonii.AAC.1
MPAMLKRPAAASASEGGQGEGLHRLGSCRQRGGRGEVGRWQRAHQAEAGDHRGRHQCSRRGIAIRRFVVIYSGPEVCVRQDPQQAWRGLPAEVPVG